MLSRCGDCRLDNLVFHPGSGVVRAVDWQTPSLGLPARDLAYLVNTSRPARLRTRMVAAYHEALLGYGVADHDAVECWDDYRWCRSSAAHTARAAHAMMMERACAAIRDHFTLQMIAV